MRPPETLINFLRENDHFLIITHLNPDGDALGSSAALAMALWKLNKKAILLCRDAVPEFYRFLPGNEQFHTFESILSSGLDASEYKNLILADCNDISRTGMEKSRLAHLTFETTAVIDHHETEKTFGDIRWIVPQVAATGMMVYYIVKELGIGISEEMAVNLYAAIVVDTGNFRFENTTADVLSVAARLAEAGARPHVIHRALNETWSEGRFKLFIKVLNTLEFHGTTVISTITRKMFEETSTSADDTENFVSFPYIMRNPQVSILLREIDTNYYKVSLRSRGDLNVAKIAEAYGGGGHKNAAGCTVRGDRARIKAELLDRLKRAANVPE
ncbi:MAG: bifunctional oligoribonuclease/PAP phosphatase NrnA [Nitrospirota bacterium]